MSNISTHLKNNLFVILSGFILLLTTLGIFNLILVQNIDTDIQSHANIVVRALTRQILPPANFLYYLTVYILSFFTPDLKRLEFVSGIVLSLAVVAKYCITYCFFFYMLGEVGITQTNKSKLITAILSFFLVFAFSYPTRSILWGQYYLGQTPPNVWHNSTVIFLMPFALLLFWLSYRQLYLPTKQRMVLISCLIVLNILIKPSFFFVLLLAYPIMLLKFFGLKRQMLLNIIPLVIGLALLFIEYYILFVLDNSRSSGISFKPFLVWNSYSPNIIVSVLASISFPLLYILLYWGDAKKDSLLHYAALLFLFGIAIFSFLAENGDQEYSGNFSWQGIVANYILFMVVLSRLIPNLMQYNKSMWKQKVLLAFFGLNVLSGIIYLVRLFVFRTYL